ncbi:MAG: hypothetical protein WC767_00030 [Candidatus Paceibacterota bacterium]|jgi:hypothetical protein
MAQKAVILKHGGGELANQLWNYVSVSAYGIERGLKVVNPSFYEHHSSFQMLEKESPAVKILSSLFRGHRGRRNSFRKKSVRLLYSVYSRVIQAFRKKSLISSENTSNEVFYLPPTAPQPSVCDAEGGSAVYFIGWLFRNPVGLSRYREALVRAFSPQGDISKRIDDIISPLREKSGRVIGIHIRQGDYKTFKGGAYWIKQSRVREVIDEYMRENNLDRDNVSFIIASDGPIDAESFRGLSTTISQEDAATDLFLLSRTDAVIGSDSSFGHFASWYGNIPHIVVTNEPMDWEYYKGREDYFENRYCTMFTP